MLHGLFGTGDNWSAVGKALSESYRVLLVDAPNHGESPWMDSMDYEAQASTVAGMIESLGFDRARVVGHSMGGKTAMALALQRPELVGTLVVVDIAPKRYEPSHGVILDAMERVSEQKPETRREADALLADSGVEGSMVRAFLLKSYRTQGPQGPGWKLNLPVIRRDYQLLLGWPDFGGSVFDGSVNVLYGSLSSYVSEDDRQLLSRHFPSIAMRRIDGAGHWLHAEKPQATISALFEMLQ